MQKTIRIGTRKSKLALVQTHMVEKMILEAFPDLKIEICEMSTKGDELLDRSLLSFGGKGVFTRNWKQLCARDRSIWLYTVPKICQWNSRRVLVLVQS